MIETEDLYPGTMRLQTQQKTRRWVLLGLTLLTSLIIATGMVAVLITRPQASDIYVLLPGFVGLCLIAIPIAVWNNPISGLYVLFAGAMLFPGSPAPAQPTVPTGYIPFWWNLSTAGNIVNIRVFSGLPVSLAEFLMVYTALCWLIRAIMSRDAHIETGMFFWPIMAYIATVTLGFVNGLVLNRGDATMALYEVRAQAQFLFAYVMTINLIRRREQLPLLLWLVILGMGLQSIFGVITYFVLSAKGALTEQGVLGHDDSLLLNVLTFVFLLVSFARADRKLAWAALAAMPTTLFSILANQRRAGIAALIVALLPLLGILWVLFAERRQQLRALITGLILFNMVYLPVAWNAQGIWALPARAIRSQTSPDQRDASSDLYRLAETEDLKFTRDVSPYIGFGYGRKFIQKIPLPLLTTDFLEYLPHNSVLWVWMRIGHLGFFCFLMMIASVLICGLQTLRDKIRDPMLKVMGILAILDILMVFTYGKFDLQLTNPRQMVIAGIFIAILAKLPVLQANLDAPEKEHTLQELKEEAALADAGGMNL